MKDEEFNLARVEELYYRSISGDEMAFSTFFSYSELAKIKLSLPGKISNSAFLYGGYGEAERNLFFFFGDETPEEEERIEKANEVIRCYLIELANPKYAEPLTHSSVLGRLMAMGIKRGMLGDILVKEDKAVVFALAKIEKELLDIDKVGKDNVKVSQIDFSDSPIVPEFEIRRITYESNRFDSILAASFRLSREEAKTYIDRGMAFLTSNPEPKATSKVNRGDHLSIKGVGKVVFIEEVGTSKKGKIVAEIKTFK